MASSSAVVTPEVVRKVAELARLRLPERELPLWTEQLSRIVDYIDQLKQIPEAAFAAGLPDAPRPRRLCGRRAPATGRRREALEENAPRRSHDYGVVPRVVGSGG